MADPHYPADLTDGVVLLRPWADGDIGCLQQAAQDPRIPEATTVPNPYTPDEGLAFVRRQHERLATGKGVSLAIADHDTDEALGMAILMVRPQRAVAGLGYWVVPAARGRGLARRAAGLLTEWGLNTAGFARIEAWVEPTNTTSQQVLEANGFEREGLLRSFLSFPTRRADVLVYSRIQP